MQIIEMTEEYWEETARINQEAWVHLDAQRLREVAHLTKHVADIANEANVRAEQLESEKILWESAAYELQREAGQLQLGQNNEVLLRLLETYAFLLKPIENLRHLHV